MSRTRPSRTEGTKAAKRARGRARAARKRRLDLLLAAGAAAAIAVVVLIAVGSALRDDGDSGSQHTAHREGRVLGSTAAPVVVTVWEDFQCPVCKTANTTVLAQIEKEYVESGKAQIHFRHYAFLGQESVLAAEASECASEQHLFWEYHDALFRAQAGENRGAFTKTKLHTLAGEVGLDHQAFGQCLDERRYKSAIEAERREGERLGIQGTPTLFINGIRVADWRRYDDVRAMIERALAGR